MKNKDLTITKIDTDSLEESIQSLKGCMCGLNSINDNLDQHVYQNEGLSLIATTLNKAIKELEKNIKE